MQSQNPIIADLVKLANSAAGTMAGMTREARESTRERLREAFGGIDLDEPPPPQTNKTVHHRTFIVSPRKRRRESTNEISEGETRVSHLSNHTEQRRMLILRGAHDSLGERLREHHFVVFLTALSEVGDEVERGKDARFKVPLQFVGASTQYTLSKHSVSEDIDALLAAHNVWTEALNIGNDLLTEIVYGHHRGISL
jgi:hypothetical protein